MIKNKLKLFILLTTLLLLVIAFFAYFPRFWAESNYPLEYKDSIRKYATEFNVDPNFVAAVIYTESRFHPDSNSGAGARGLMQIMPATGAGLAQRLGLQFSPDMLFDPDYSIHLGTKYLREQLDNYDGDIDLVLASYNAGGGRATAWKLYGEALPKETIGFIAKVKNTKSMYDQIYGQWYNEMEVRKPNPFYVGITNIDSFVKGLFTGQR